jgi:hypothetical protein
MHTNSTMADVMADTERQLHRLTEELAWAQHDGTLADTTRMLLAEVPATPVARAVNAAFETLARQYLATGDDQRFVDAVRDLARRTRTWALAVTPYS